MFCPKWQLQHAVFRAHACAYGEHPCTVCAAPRRVPDGGSSKPKKVHRRTNRAVDSVSSPPKTMSSSPSFSLLPLLLLNLRRSTIEVHPKFSEAPHLRSSVPHPKTDVSTNQNASPRIISSPKSKKKRRFSKHDWHSGDFGLGNPVIQKTFWWKCGTSIVERVRLLVQLLSLFSLALQRFRCVR